MKLSPVDGLALAIIAGVLEIVNRYALVAAGPVHTTISLVLMFVVGVGVIPLTGGALRKLIPVHVAAILASVAGVLQVLQQETLGVSATVHTVISFALFALAALGIVPTTAPAVV